MVFKNNKNIIDCTNPRPKKKLNKGREGQMKIRHLQQKLIKSVKWEEKREKAMPVIERRKQRHGGTI